MKVRTISLDDDGLPSMVSADLDLHELVMLAKTIGRTSPNERDTAVPGSGTVLSMVYDEIAAVLNRFFDDGVDDAYWQIYR